jgi:hypothetical protein
MSDESPYRPRRGRYATVIPYIRGLSPRDELLRWWLLMDQHGGQKYIFWADQSGYETLRGDPIAFLDSFSARLAFACYDNATEELVGFNWVEHLKPRHHGQYGMYYKPKTPREVTRDATFLTTMAVFEYYTALPALFGFTPWKAALQHGKALGWQHVATLPGFAQMGDACKDIYVLKLDRP